MLRKYLPVVCAWLLLSPGAAARATTINPDGTQTNLIVRASQGGGHSPFAENEMNPTSLPFINSDFVQQSDSLVDADYSLETSGFEVAVEQVRGGIDAAFARAWGDIYFSVASSSDYALTGEYSMVSSVGGLLTYEVWLYDETAATTVFFNVQDSTATPDEAFVLGGEGGDRSNQLSGSLMGTLQAGHTYRLEYIYELRHFQLPSGPTASASGFTRLSIVPEPSVATLAAICALALMVRRRHPTG